MEALSDNVHSALTVGIVSSTCVMGTDGREEGIEPDECVLRGRLKNLESLRNLESLLSNLPELKRVKLAQIIRRYPALFGDMPTCTHWMEHDIDVGDAKPIRQRFYRVSPEYI